MNLNELRDRAHDNSKKHGFWQGNTNIGEKLMLIVTEVAEAMECYRENEMYNAKTPEGKPVGFASELADVFIRIGDLAGHLDIDLDKAVADKMAYNETRSFRHGGKRA
jgi:NTP pyrophosphatase (non-canonical NTP hydrolase)